MREHARCSRAGLGAGGVKGAVLGKDRRYAPDRTFDTLHVRLELSVDCARRTLEGTCVTTVRALKDGVRRLDFDAGGMTVSGASAGGKRLRHVRRGERLEVFLPKALAAGADTDVSVRYKVKDPRRGFHFTGPSRETPDAPRQGWSQGQPEDAHFWFPCHDSPHEKATTEIIARVPKGFVAVSNGTLLSRRPDGAREAFHWRLDHPHSLYLVTLSVGRFADVREKWEGVPVVYGPRGGRQARLLPDQGRPRGVQPQVRRALPLRGLHPGRRL
ncbi:MAG: aminopeptidase N [Elusimicrobia bacterium]|nr:MAG: aminopeptidase N [Elusimicrobiota bacterium]